MASADFGAGVTRVSSARQAQSETLLTHFCSQSAHLHICAQNFATGFSLEAYDCRRAADSVAVDAADAAAAFRVSFSTYS